MPGRAKGLLAQQRQLVAHPGGLFKLQVPGMVKHLFFKQLDALGQVFLAQRLNFGRLHQASHLALVVLRIDHPVDQLFDLLDNAARRDAQRQVVGDLLVAAALGFTDGPVHRLGHLVGIQDGAAIDVARGPANGLDQAALAAQKALLVGIQDRHQRHLGNVQPLAQQVDAHQHIEHAQPQVAQDLNPLHGVDVRMQVAHLHAVVAEVIGQLLGHALGQGGDQHPLMQVDPDADLLKHIVHLVAGRPHLDHRINQTGGPHQLLDHRTGMLLLVGGGCGRDKHRLADLALELFELQRPVVHRTGQAKAVFHQGELARPVAVVHAAQLADQHMAFIEKHHRVLRQVIDQRGRWIARPGAREVPAVVFDAFAMADLLHHFQVEAGALLQPLRLDQFAVAHKLGHPLTQLGLDGLDGGHHPVARRHVVAFRVDGEARHFLPHPAGQRVQQAQRFDLVIEQLHPQRQLAVLGRKDVDRVAAHPKRAARKVHVVAAVLHADQLGYCLALAHLVAHPHDEAHLRVVLGFADAVDGADRCHDHRVAPLQHAFGGRQPHLLDVLVDR